jgi:SCY1-like protein 3
MLYRHPCILKFVSSWKKNGRIHLATEEVKPLASVITSLTPLQICVGLHSILKALVFLHDKVRIVQLKCRILYKSHIVLQSSFLLA